MKRFTLLMTLLGIATAAFAEEPAFCTSMCSSEKKACLANVDVADSKDNVLATNSTDKNPFARTAQLEMRSSDNGSLDKVGYQHRRMTRNAACNDAWQRCTRSCTVDAKDDAVGKVVARHAKKQN